ncbi:IctB family putative bicarbonate transporter, partial [Merismopedia glauca]
SQWGAHSYLFRILGGLQGWREGSWLLQWDNAIGAVFIGLVFGLAPFVSNSLTGWLLASILGYWLLLTLSEPKIWWGTQIHRLVWLYWGVASIATAFSPVKKDALVGWSKLTLYLGLFMLLARVLKSPRLRSWLIFLYLQVSLIVSIYGIRQWIAKVKPLATWNDPDSAQADVTRAYSYLGNPNLLAAYLLPAIALSIAAIFIWRGWLPKLLAITIAVTDIACLKFTDSRGGLLGLIALSVTFVVLLFFWRKAQLPTFWRRWFLPIVLGTLTFGLVVLVAFLPGLRDRFLLVFSAKGDSSSQFRVNVWKGVVKMIQARPIIGIGPGNNAFNKIYPLYQISPEYTALGAYSILLEIAIESGFIGLVTFLWLLGTIFHQGLKQLSRLKQVFSVGGFWLVAAGAGIVGLLVHGLVDTVWYRPEVNSIWWLMVGIVAAFVAQEQEYRLKSSNYPDNSMT